MSKPGLHRLDGFAKEDDVDLWLTALFLVYDSQCIFKQRI